MSQQTPPPPPPGWQPPPPERPQPGGYDPTVVQWAQPIQQYRQHPDQNLYEQVTQPAAEKKKPPKWAWVVGGVVALAILGALLPDTDEDTGFEEEIAAVADEEADDSQTTTTAESTTTFEEATTATSETTTTTAAPVESDDTLSDEEAEELAHGLALQLILDDKWPDIGLANRQDPSIVSGMADATCTVLETSDGTDEGNGFAIALMWSRLDAESTAYFSGLEDFAEFVGTLAGYRCPGTLG